MGSVPISAGLALFRRDRQELLLVHPTNAAWWGTWSIPKGLVNPRETTLNAAIRETHEEIGLTIEAERVDPVERAIHYLDKKGRTTKIVVWYLADVDDLPDRLPTSQLQLAEVDQAEFVNAELAEKRILGRLQPLLSHFRR